VPYIENPGQRLEGLQEKLAFNRFPFSNDIVDTLLTSTGHRTIPRAMDAITDIMVFVNLIVTAFVAGWIRSLKGAVNA
jgi:hypothetical protein